jgi:hypothetical protein
MLARRYKEKKMKPIRIPVTITHDENQLLINLQAVLQSKVQKRLSVAEIVRMALRELAKANNVAC